jgi:hypothetical protein
VNEVEPIANLIEAKRFGGYPAITGRMVSIARIWNNRQSAPLADGVAKVQVFKVAIAFVEIVE